MQKTIEKDFEFCFAWNSIQKKSTKSTNIRIVGEL